jgi:hypothetical protein
VLTMLSTFLVTVSPPPRLRPHSSSTVSDITNPHVHGTQANCEQPWLPKLLSSVSPMS